MLRLLDRLAEDVADLKTRMTAVEEGVAALAHGLAGVNRRRVPAPVGRRPDEEARRLDLAR